MVGRSLSEQRWSRTYEAAELKVTAMILQAQAEWSGTKREGYVMAERAIKHYKMMIIITINYFSPPFLLEKRQ